MDKKFLNKHYRLKINEKVFKLVYETKKYIRIDENLLESLNILKSHGRKIKQFDGIWYELEYDRLIPIQTRINIINKILGIQTTAGSFMQDIENKWFFINCHKKTSTALMDNYSIILDILSSYFIAGYENDDILDKNKISYIYSKECYSINGLNDIFSNNVEYIPRQKNIISSVIGKKQEKKWKNSVTYKLNDIFSLKINDKGKYWDWIQEEWKEYKDDILINKNFIIDSNKPYFSKWCYVNTYNEFIFRDNLYRIDNKLEGYNISDYSFENDNEKSLMDTIFVIEQDYNKYFFDMQMRVISEKHIMKVDG